MPPWCSYGLQTLESPTAGHKSIGNEVSLVLLPTTCSWLHQSFQVFGLVEGLLENGHMSSLSHPTFPSPQGQGVSQARVLLETVMSSCPSSCRHPACIWYAGTLQAIRFFVFLPEILLTRKMWLYKKAVPGCYSYPFPGKKKPECML